MNNVEKYIIENNIRTIGTPPDDLRKIFPDGAMLFDVRYSNQGSEQFEVVYIDPSSHALEVKYVPAIVDIYFTKKEYRYLGSDFIVDPYFRDKLRYSHTDDEAYQLAQMEMTKLFRVFCKPSQIPAMIDKYAGDARMYSEDGSHLIDTTYHEFFVNAKDSGLTRSEITRKMCQNPWSYKADFQPDVYFRIRWMHEYGEEVDLSKIESAYLDIEIDVVDRTVDLRNPLDVSQPVNVATVIFPAQKYVLVTILSPRPKQQLAEKFHPLLEKQQAEYDWLVEHKEEFIEMIKGDHSPADCPVEVDFDKYNQKYISDYTIDVRFFDYHSEIKLIATIFSFINKFKPEFVFSWNAPFDHNYLMNRPKYLGYDPASLMIPPQFQTCRLDYVFDKTGNFQIKTSRDFFYTSTYSQYMCQMRLYAAIRKSQQEEPSYGLDAIGSKVADIHKIGDVKSGLFREFAYTNFLLFILYNIRDVVCQTAIDFKCKDSQTLYARSYDFTTSFAKCFQETHIVRNAKESLYETFGYIMSNRAVVDKTKDGAFQGAYVADPHLNAPTGLVLSGRQTNNILFGASDLDATAMYPSHKMGDLLDKLAMLYKMIIDNNVFIDGLCNNRSYNQEYIWKDSKNKPHNVDISGPMMNSFKNGNHFSLLSNYFNAPVVTDVILRMRRTLKPEGEDN